MTVAADANEMLGNGKSGQANNTQMAKGQKRAKGRKGDRRIKAKEKRGQANKGQKGTGE